MGDSEDPLRNCASQDQIAAYNGSTACRRRFSKNERTTTKFSLDDPDCESLCLADKFFSRISINEFSQPRKRLSPHDHGIAFPCPRQFQNFFGSPRSIHQITRVGFDRPAVGSALASDCIIAVQGPLFCFRVGRFPSQFICSDTLFFCTPDLNQLAWSAIRLCAREIRKYRRIVCLSN